MDADGLSASGRLRVIVRGRLFVRVDRQQKGAPMDLDTALQMLPDTEVSGLEPCTPYTCDTYTHWTQTL